MTDEDPPPANDCSVKIAQVIAIASEKGHQFDVRFEEKNLPNPPDPTAFPIVYLDGAGTKVAEVTFATCEMWQDGVCPDFGCSAAFQVRVKTFEQCYWQETVHRVNCGANTTLHPTDPNQYGDGVGGEIAIDQTLDKADCGCYEIRIFTLHDAQDNPVMVGGSALAFWMWCECEPCPP